VVGCDSSDYSDENLNTEFLTRLGKDFVRVAEAMISIRAAAPWRRVVAAGTETTNAGFGTGRFRLGLSRARPLWQAMCSAKIPRIPGIFGSEMWRVNKPGGSATPRVRFPARWSTVQD
jgi:hypothetical protein